MIYVKQLIELDEKNVLLFNIACSTGVEIHENAVLQRVKVAIKFRISIVHTPFFR